MRAEKGSDQRITGSITKMFQERYNGDVEWIQSILCLSIWTPAFMSIHPFPSNILKPFLK
jgi:hypothetical protein